MEKMNVFEVTIKFTSVKFSLYEVWKEVRALPLLPIMVGIVHKDSFNTVEPKKDE